MLEVKLELWSAAGAGVRTGSGSRPDPSTVHHWPASPVNKHSAAGHVLDPLRTGLESDVGSLRDSRLVLPACPPSQKAC